MCKVLTTQGARAPTLQGSGVEGTMRSCRATHGVAPACTPSRGRVDVMLSERQTRTAPQRAVGSCDVPPTAKPQRQEADARGRGLGEGRGAPAHGEGSPAP